MNVDVIDICEVMHGLMTSFGVFCTNKNFTVEDNWLPMNLDNSMCPIDWGVGSVEEVDRVLWRFGRKSWA